MTGVEIVSGLIMFAGYIVGLIISMRRFRDDIGHPLTYLATWLALVLATKPPWQSLLPTASFSLGSAMSVGEAISVAILMIVLYPLWVEATWYLWLALRRLYRLVPKP